MYPRREESPPLPLPTRGCYWQWKRSARCLERESRGTLRCPGASSVAKLGPTGCCDDGSSIVSLNYISVHPDGVV